MATSSQPWSGESQQQEEQQESSGGGSDGSGGPSEEAKRRARNFQIATGAACGFLGASYLLYWQLSVKAAEATVVKEVCIGVLNVHVYVCVFVYVCVCVLKAEAHGNDYSNGL